MIKVYISGPLSNDDPEIVKQNIARATSAAAQLVILGYLPFVPHYTQYIHEACVSEFCNEVPYDTWINNDLHWIDICDCMLYLGSSKGADIEKAYCKKVGKPVFTSCEDLHKEYDEGFF